MKRTLLLLSALAVGFSSFAQTESIFSTNVLAPDAQNINTKQINGALAKTTTTITGNRNLFESATDSLNRFRSDSTVLYRVGTTLDSGYAFGPNYFGWNQFAEQVYNPYNFDTTINSIVGVLSYWHGTVKTGSTRVITFNEWGFDTKAYLHTGSVGQSAPKDSIIGVPGTILQTSQSVSISQLGIGTSTVADVPKVTMFTSAWPAPNNGFFIGYSTTYTAPAGAFAGDTIGLRASTKSSTGICCYYQLGASTADTFLLGTNYVHTGGGNANGWQDLRWDFGRNIDFAIVPIVSYKIPNAGVKGLTISNLTLSGNYPNPAVNSTTIKVGLKNNDDVTVTVMDMEGRTLSTLTKNGLSAGDQLIELNTSSLPAGNYLYMVRAAGGGAFASKLSVVK